MSGSETSDSHAQPAEESATEVVFSSTADESSRPLPDDGDQASQPLRGSRGDDSQESQGLEPVVKAKKKSAANAASTNYKPVLTSAPSSRSGKLKKKTSNKTNTVARRARKQAYSKDRQDEQFEIKDLIDKTTSELPSLAEQYEQIVKKRKKKYQSKKLKDTKGLADAASDIAPSSRRSSWLKTCKTLKAHDGKIVDLKWCRDEPRLLCTVATDGLLLVWDAPTAYKRDAVILRTASNMTCAISPAGTAVAVGGLMDTVDFYNLNDQRPNVLDGHEAMIADIQFVDNERLISCSGDGTVKLWDLERKKCLRTFTGHSAEVLAIACDPTSTDIFVSGSADCSALVWDTRLDSGPTHAYESTDRPFALSASGDTNKHTIAPDGHLDEVRSVSFFPSGHAFATGSADTTARLFDLRANRELAIYNTKGAVPNGDQKAASVVNKVGFSVTGRYLFGASQSGVARVWDTLKCDTVFDIVHQSPADALSVSSDGMGVATGAWDGFVRIWA